MKPWGWGDSSVGKLQAMPAEDVSSDPPESMFTREHITCNLNALTVGGTWRWESPWRLSHPSAHSSKQTTWKEVEGKKELTPKAILSPHTYTLVHMHAHTD